MPLLQDKVAIVTGAGRGIGRGVAKLMAQEGASVVVCDLGVNVDGTGADVSVAQQVVNEIKEDGGNAVACTESVALMEGGEKIVQTAIDTFGKLDIVVTVAGILRDRMVFNMTEQEWDDVIAVHLKGTFTVVKHASILFRQQRSGRIITFSSTSGLYGNSGQANYGAAKDGIAGFTRVCARDLGTLRRDGQLHFAVGEHPHDDERAGRSASVAFCARHCGRRWIARRCRGRGADGHLAGFRRGGACQRPRVPRYRRTGNAAQRAGTGKEHPKAGTVDSRRTGGSVPGHDRD